jgi:hypothetical protein
MGNGPPEAGWEFQVPAEEREVALGAVSAGETWSFSAAGNWSTGVVSCGPDGYRNFFYDALDFKPRAPGEARLKLMGKFRGDRDSEAFPIGAGCTQTFTRSGALVAFANDRRQGYADNRGAVTLIAAPGGVAPAPDEDGGVSGIWTRFRDVFSRTKGIPVIAAFVLGVSWILVFMQQGQDLVRGIGEDDFLQYGDRLLQIAFAGGLLFLALQAWSWSRIIIDSNYGADRANWRPKQFLVWTPRILGALPFFATAWALSRSPARNTWFVLALIVIGLIFFVVIVKRQDIETGLRRRAAARGMAPHFERIQRTWVIFGLVMAAVAMVVATVWPTWFGALGGPAIVFLGLGLIIPVIVIAIQMGSGLRIPVAGALLALAIVFGLWVDNHGMGRRAFATATTGPTVRPTLTQAYEQWKKAQPGGPGASKTMILVAVQGGASRAGYWTAVALANLREAAKAKGVDIDSHIFALSSVSGGSVGAVGYAAMLKAAPADDDFKLRLMRFAGQNVLGGAVTGLMFPDLLQRFLPVTFLPDRAETLERSWEDAWASMDPQSPSAALMREPFLNLAPKAGEPWRPLLIVQGASENGGRRFLTSSIKFGCDEIDADDVLDSIGHDVAASTAILNGARFPWISPGGTFSATRCGTTGSQTDHILDGGYFDGAGAETLREMARALHAIRAEADDKDPLDIVFVLIGYADHDPGKPPPGPEAGIKTWLSDRVAALVPNDVFAPLLGLFASMSAHEAHLAREMKLVGQSKIDAADPYVSRMSGDHPYAALVLCKGPIVAGGPDYDPPLDWTLSGQAKRYIEDSVIPTTPACNAKANAEAIDAVVERLKR